MANRITNTTERPRIEWLFGANPSAIEAQEKQGQEELTAERDIHQLPKETSNGVDARGRYVALGIEFIGETKGDDLFHDVRLPKGWKIEATAHSMWSTLVDETGKERGDIFYKAAFYDRKAFINIK